MMMMIKFEGGGIRTCASWKPSEISILISSVGQHFSNLKNTGYILNFALFVATKLSHIDNGF